MLRGSYNNLKLKYDRVNVESATESRRKNPQAGGERSNWYSGGTTATGKDAAVTEHGTQRSRYRESAHHGRGSNTIGSRLLPSNPPTATRPFSSSTQASKYNSLAHRRLVNEVTKTTAYRIDCDPYFGPDFAETKKGSRRGKSGYGGMPGNVKV